MRPLLLCSALCLSWTAHYATAAPTSPSTSGSQIQITTHNGRLLRGVLDIATDDERLWLRQDQGPIALAASAAWSDIATATLAGQGIAVDDLRELRGKLVSPRPSNGFSAEKSAPRSKPIAPAARRRIRSVQIVDACLVNLDRDVEPDGLTVTIAAIGDDGRPAAMRGSLTARLFGEKRPNDAAVVAFPELDHWTQPVTTRDFVDGLATYELRFRGTAPEWQWDLLPDAVLDVTLGAFGQGNYAASTPVVVRRFNPLRDHQQQRDGSRFMPNELRGREPSSAPAIHNGLWSPSYLNVRPQ